MKFKGDPLVKKKKKKKIRHGDNDKAAEHFDTRHGGQWWLAKELSQVKGRVVFEGPCGCYLKILPEGEVTVGPLYDEQAHVEAEHRAIKEALDRQEREEEPTFASPENQVPSPHESLMAVPVGDDAFVALKCWTGQFMTVDREGRVCFTREAVSQREMWKMEMVEDAGDGEGRVRLRSPDERYLTFGVNGDIRATEIKPGPSEAIKVRTNATRPAKTVEKKERSTDRQLRQMEENEARRFQSYKDQKMRVSEDELTALKRAQRKGTVNTTLLNRRAKMKADRYCK